MADSHVALPKADTLQKEAFGATERELEAIVAYQEAIRQQGENREGEEEQGRRKGRQLMSSASEFIARLQHVLRSAKSGIACIQSRPSSNTLTLSRSVIDSCVGDKGVCVGTNFC